MKKMSNALKRLPTVTGLVALLAVAGCNFQLGGKPVSDLERLQGSWVGKEVGRPGQCSLVFSENTIDFKGAHPQDWYQGTVVLNEQIIKEGDFTIIACAAPQYEGTVAMSIYTLKNDVLFLAGSEPGSGVRPGSFAATDLVRVFRFKRQEAE
jgi:hypothetical protein